MTENVPEGPQGDAAVWFGLTPPSTLDRFAMGPHVEVDSLC